MNKLARGLIQQHRVQILVILIDILATFHLNMLIYGRQADLHVKFCRYFGAKMMQMPTLRAFFYVC